MSMDVMVLVWDMDVPPADKLILLKMADVADDDGELKYKNKDKDRFAARCSTSERTLKRFRKKYTELGVITVTDPGGGRGKERTDCLNLDRRVVLVPAHSRVGFGAQNWERLFR
jgi:hypothetical protein